MGRKGLLIKQFLNNAFVTRGIKVETSIRIALTVTATNMNRCCWFIFGQDKLPDNAKKLRKF